MKNRTRSAAVTVAAALGAGVGSFGMAAAQTDAPSTLTEEQVPQLPVVVATVDPADATEDTASTEQVEPTPDSATEEESEPEVEAEEAEDPNEPTDATDADYIQHENEHEGGNDPDEGHED